ncbi:MAG: hypothetical protein J6Y07_01605 [Alphaproteobacteria bacterium]|nr:hypothetical protein [Alphaproteobacteria bacterium]
MQMEIIEANDEIMTLSYAVARVVYAETLAKSLQVVEALTSMIFNAALHDIKNVRLVISDSQMFESLRTESTRHEFLSVDASRRDFQMCLRIAKTMLHGNLPDTCHHAVKFHRTEFLPSWAVARGYIYDLDGILFYT